MCAHGSSSFVPVVTSLVIFNFPCKVDSAEKGETAFPGSFKGLYLEVESTRG